MTLPRIPDRPTEAALRGQVETLLRDNALLRERVAELSREGGGGGGGGGGDADAVRRVAELRLEREELRRQLDDWWTWSGDVMKEVHAMGEARRTARVDGFLEELSLVCGRSPQELEAVLRSQADKLAPLALSAVDGAAPGARRVVVRLSGTGIGVPHGRVAEEVRDRLRAAGRSVEAWIEGDPAERALVVVEVPL
jgi:hypothetical protein